jgi:excisionase family DNA binding protein
MTKGLNVRAAATRLGCSVDHLKKLIAAGELRAVNIGLGKQRARWMVSEAEIEAFRERRSNQRPETPLSDQKPSDGLNGVKDSRAWV